MIFWVLEWRMQAIPSIMWEEAFGRVRMCGSLSLIRLMNRLFIASL